MLRSLVNDDSRSVVGQPLKFNGLGCGAPCRLGIAGSVIIGLLLTGCSRVPDAVNPVEWYKGTVKFFAGEDEPEAAAAKNGAPAKAGDQPPPGADRPFPNLSQVPERPRTTGSADRQQVVEGLVADRDAARYSSEVIRRQSEVVNALPPPGSAVAARPAGAQNAAAAAPPRPAAPAPVTPPAPAQAVAAVPPSVPEPSSLPPPPPSTGASPATGTSPARSTAAVQPPAPSQAPRPATAPQERPPASVEETFRARLAQQQQLPAEAARNSLDAAGGAGSTSAIGFDTVVVSSEGVRTVGGSPNAPSVARGAAATSVPVLPVVSAEAQDGSGSKVATIVFNDGSARLGNGDARILRAVTAIHRERGGRVLVVGHASSRTRTMDSMRHQQINQQVSAARANAVANALVAMGVPRSAISVIAKADTNPMYYEVMPSGEAGNRRAEIYIDS